MRHGIVGKNLSRKTAHLVALRRNLASSLFEHGQVTTTVTKAQHVQPFVEKLITLARKGTLHARKLIIARMQDRDLIDVKTDKFVTTAVKKLFEEIAPKYADRAGGYTRVIQTSKRRVGDASELVVLQLVDPAEHAKKKPTNVTPRRRRAKARYALAERRESKPAARPEAEVPAPPSTPAGPPESAPPAEGEQKA